MLTRTKKTKGGRGKGGKADRHVKVDGRRRKMTASLNTTAVRDIKDAYEFARWIGHPLDSRIDFHPSALMNEPGDVGEFLRVDFRPRLARWFSLRGLGLNYVMVRENYIGLRREHAHFLIDLAPELRQKLEDAIRGWYDAAPHLVRVGPLSVRYENGREVPEGLNYRLKQADHKAHGPPREERVRRETVSRYDGSPVAPVLGRRYSISDTLNISARGSWQVQRDERRRRTAERYAEMKRQAAAYPAMASRLAA